MKFADILNNLIKEKNISNYELSREIGIHQTTIANWLSGDSAPHKKNLKRLSDYFDVSVEYLEGKTDIKEKAVSISGNGLSEAEIKLIELWRSFSPKEQELALKMLSALRG